MTDATPTGMYPFPQCWPFHCWHFHNTPATDDCGQTPVEFLSMMTGPAHLYIRGRDSARCRMVVTLLHGNEPSGLIGIHRLLKQGTTPAVDIHCLIPGVLAAREAPGFFYRMRPGERDLNRCFRPPFDDNPQSQLARGILDTIAALQPEAVIDIHNTSGSGPSFGVTTFMDARHDALVSLFTQRMIVTELALGALMEISESMVPTVTIECGGAQDEEAHRKAEDGLREYCTRNDVLSPPAADFALDFFHNPVRLEALPPATIAYQDQPSEQADITLLPTLEHHNFGFIEADTLLGFLRGNLDDLLTARDSLGRQTLRDNFTLEQGVLKTARRLKLFMVTSNPEIALKDCLFYLVPAEGC